MKKVDEIRAAVDDLTEQFKVATDEVASDLQKLRDQVAALPIGATDAELDALKADIDSKLGAAKDRLVELGKDPENPVPAPVEEPPTA